MSGPPSPSAPLQQSMLPGRHNRIDLHRCTAPAAALDGVVYGSDTVTNYVRVRVGTALHPERAEGIGAAKIVPISYSIAYVERPAACPRRSALIAPDGFHGQLEPRPPSTVHMPVGVAPLGHS
jgi:hypothetical protein